MSSRPLRILYIIDFWGTPGGTERHLSYLTSHLDRNHFVPSVVIFNYQPNAMVDQVRKLGIEGIHIPVARFYTPMAMLQGFRLWRFIRSRQIDLVQTFHFKSDIYGAIIARLAGVRHIVSSKRDAADYKNAFHFWMHRLVGPITQNYIAVSEVTAAVIRNKERAPADKVKVIHNGVDLHWYSVPDAGAKARHKAALGFSAEDFVIGMSAWFRPEKDHQLLIDAFLELHSTAPSCRLLLVGDGPLYNRYFQWAREQKLEHVIKLTGAVDDVRPLLSAMDIACLVPKINEGFSNSILEKMATGLPVIVTDIGGNKEAVAEGQTGFVIAPGDQAALAKKLQVLHSDAGLRSSMGIAARRRAENLFSLESMIARHSDLYISMMQTDGGIRS
jgi:glycosyltransferase involved in cell wall biosynthesis